MLDPSTVASSRYFECDKLYSKIWRKPGNKKATRQKQEYDSYEQGHTDRGKKFHRSLEKLHNIVIKPCENEDDFNSVLQNAKKGQYLGELPFFIDEDFYREKMENNANYKFGNFRPDILKIDETPDGKKLVIRIIEAKSSKLGLENHKLQVATYYFLLSHILKQFDNFELDKEGQIWTPKGEDLCTFNLEKLQTKVKELYAKKLKDIYGTTEPKYRLGPKCIDCKYLKECQESSAGKIRSLPKDISEQIGFKNGENLETKLSESISIKDNKHAMIFRDVSGDDKPRFLDFTSFLTAKEFDHAFYISLPIDSYSLKPYAFSWSIYTKEKSLVNLYTDFIALSREELQVKNSPKYCEFVKKIIDELTKVLKLMDGKRCLFYVYQDKEMKEIRSFLYDLVKSEGKNLELSGGNDTVKRLIDDAKTCFLSLFPSKNQLKTLTGPKDDQEALCVDVFVSIYHLLKENVVLPTPQPYHVTDAAQHMAKGVYKKEFEMTNKELHSLWNKHNKKLTIEGITEVKQHFTDRFDCLHKIMESYMELANDIDTDIFPLECKPFKWQNNTSRSLEKKKGRFYTMESGEENQWIQKRMHCSFGRIRG